MALILSIREQNRGWSTRQKQSTVGIQLPEKVIKRTILKIKTTFQGPPTPSIKPVLADIAKKGQTLGWRWWGRGTRPSVILNIRSYKGREESQYSQE